MSEQSNYFDKYLESQFTQINASMSELKTQFGELKNQFAEVKADNKATRHWVLGSAITFFVGFIAAAIAIFFGFAQLQTSWIQTVISFVGKTIVK
jgi:hypothetical protein